MTQMTRKPQMTQMMQMTRKPQMTQRARRMPARLPHGIGLLFAEPFQPTRIGAIALEWLLADGTALAAAMMNWVYEPGVLNGVPVPVILVVSTP